jgi:DNA polymerase III sliding clamp (beta) subunit (PCNA family)
MLYGQFPNYEMVMPKNNDKMVEFESSYLPNQAIRRVALMADERSHAIRFHLERTNLLSVRKTRRKAKQTKPAD